MTDAFPASLWLIGCGNMAGAMLEGWLRAGLDAARVTVIRPSKRAPAPGVRTLTEAPEGEAPAVLLLGVKPQKLDEVAPGLAPIVGRETILVSILAGVELATLRARFPAAGAVVKAMPNLPVALGKGVVELLAEPGAGEAAARIDRLMATLGRTELFEEEALFNVASGLTGAAPAFLFRFLDALAGAGEQLGLPADQSRRLAAAMAEGASALAAASPETPAELARRVASPGGTTEAGLDVLDGEDGLRPLMLRTLEASRRRGAEMAEAARRGRET